MHDQVHRCLIVCGKFPQTYVSVFLYVAHIHAQCLYCCPRLHTHFPHNRPYALRCHIISALQHGCQRTVAMLPSQPVHVTRATNHGQNDHSAKSTGCQHRCKPNVKQRNGLHDKPCHPRWRQFKLYCCSGWLNSQGLLLTFHSIIVCL